MITIIKLLESRVNNILDHNYFINILMHKNDILVP